MLHRNRWPSNSELEESHFTQIPESEPQQNVMTACSFRYFSVSVHCNLRFRAVAKSLCEKGTTVSHSLVPFPFDDKGNPEEVHIERRICKSTYDRIETGS